MAGIVLENEPTDNVDTAELSTEAITYIKEFRDRVSGDKEISKNDILSLEEFIGSQVVTNRVNMNRLTEVRSTMGYLDVIETLDAVIKDAPVEEKLTIQELTKLHAQTIYKIKRLTRSLTQINNGLTNELTKTIYDMFKPTWTDEDTLTQPTGEELLSVIRSVNIEMFIALRGIETLPLFSVLKTTDNIVDMLYGGPPNIEQLTIVDIITIVRNPDVVTQLNKLVHKLNNKMGKLSLINELDNLDIADSKKVKNILNLLDDKGSNIIINALSGAVLDKCHK